MTIDPKVWIEIMGSYRRGQETSGDVDILITRDTADGFDHSGVLKRLVDRLQVRGIITHDVSSFSRHQSRMRLLTSSSASHLTGKRSRQSGWAWGGWTRTASTDGSVGIGAAVSFSLLMTDILCIPFEQWGAALIYFTGKRFALCDTSSR